MIKKTVINKLLLCSIAMLACIATSGCGGFYVLTVPDHVASADKTAVATLRLQRNDFFVLTLAEEGRPMRFSITPVGAAHNDSSNEYEMSARTDDNGYAGVPFSMANSPVNGTPGIYDLHIKLQDMRGFRLNTISKLYVWDPKKPVVVVELNAIPMMMGGLNNATKVLKQLKKKANIVYLTDVYMKDYSSVHQQLKDFDYPDGPVLLWEYRRWRIEKLGRFGMRMIRFSPHLDSNLALLKKQFPNLQKGICITPDAINAFNEAGIQPLVVYSGSDWSKLGL